MTAKKIIDLLGLLPHPEGGFYRETYRSKAIFNLEDGRVRHASTAIYYLLSDREKSHFHRIRSDEAWLFHKGAPLDIWIITAAGTLELITLGNRLDLQEVPQTIIPAGTWFAAQVKNEEGFALVTCTVSPGFDFEDFEMGTPKDLLTTYPHLESTIRKFTRS